MLRFILIRKHRHSLSGAEWQEHVTLDAACPDLEAAIRSGGMGETGYEVTQLVGVECRPDTSTTEHE